jgi:predicted RNA binding protein YcfA (HicA-like mRNA interferase family)
MPKLPVLKPVEMVRLLKKHGFVEDHQTGSHLVLLHPATRRRAVVPMHPRDLPRGTTLSILKSAGIEFR